MKKAKVVERRRLFDDFFKIDELQVTYQKRDGTMTPPLRHLVFERGDSVAVVVHDRGHGHVLMIEQFRTPTFDKGPGWLLELPAGKIDAGEVPEAAARREVEEEMGYRLRDLKSIGKFYPSPGGSSERIFLFYAEVNGGDRMSKGGGLEVEHEDIGLAPVPVERMRAMLDGGELEDGKTLIGLQWMLRNIK